jgi:hypothetical protein
MATGGATASGPIAVESWWDAVPMGVGEEVAHSHEQGRRTGAKVGAAIDEFDS